MTQRACVLFALALALTGCPRDAAPSAGPSNPVPPPAAASEPAPRVTEFGDALPDDPAAAPSTESAAEQAAWDALTQRIAGWPRLVPGMLKNDAQRATLEAPFLTDQAATDRLALLTRYLPVHDRGAGHVMRLTSPLHKHLAKVGAGLESFQPEDHRTILWLVLMDPYQVRRTRWLQTKAGWASVQDVGSGSFELAYAKGLREAVEFAHAGAWDQALPRYTETLIAIAKTTSDRHGAKSQAAWKKVSGLWEGESAALEGALEAWWTTFKPSKDRR